VEAIDEPGGGKRVRLREPHGYQIEVVYGIKSFPAMHREAPAPQSRNDSLKRAGTLDAASQGQPRG